MEDDGGRPVENFMRRLPMLPKVSRPGDATKTLQANGTLRAGWNAVVFKCSIPFNPSLNHHLAFWSFTVDLLGEDPDNMRIFTDPRTSQAEK